MNNKLAAAQAREKVLWDALETIQLGEGENGCILSAGDCSRIAYEVLTNQPTDDTALNNLLAEGQAREKVLHSLSNELLHQIDINDFTDSHGHSAKMLKAVHDLMKYNTQPSDDTALNNLLAEGQAREKVLRDALAVSQARERKLRSDARLVQGAENATQREHAFGMLVEHLGVWDESYLRDALAAERERCVAAIRHRVKRFVISNFVGGTPVEDDCIEAIRALGDE